MFADLQQWTLLLQGRYVCGSETLMFIFKKKKDSYLAVDKLAYVLEKDSNDQQ